MAATGLDEAGARAAGEQVRASIKALAKDAEPGNLAIPQVFSAPAVAPAPAAPPAPAATPLVKPQSPEEKMAEVVRHLHARGMPVVLIGGGAERSRCDEIEALVAELNALDGIKAKLIDLN